MTVTGRERSRIGAGWEVGEVGTVREEGVGDFVPIVGKGRDCICICIGVGIGVCVANTGDNGDRSRIGVDVGVRVRVRVGDGDGNSEDDDGGTEMDSILIEINRWLLSGV